MSRKFYHRALTNESDFAIEDSKEEGSSIIGAAAKGVYGLASRKLSNFSSESKLFSSNTNVLELAFLKPTSELYPKYEHIVSVQEHHMETIPLLQTVPIGISAQDSLEIGPDEGFFELLDYVETRRAYLRSLQKQFEKNPNFQDEENPKAPASLEEVKLKLHFFRTVKRDLKKLTPSLHLQRNSRVSFSDSRLFGKTLDTYAFDFVKNERAGQPNADGFYAEGCSKFVCFAVADGIGWGVGSRRASQSALLGFMSCIRLAIVKYNLRTQFWDTHSIARVCLKAITNAHEFTSALCDAKTTFAGGVIVELVHQESVDDKKKKSAKRPKRKRWAFVGVSVGDSLIYRYSAESKTVVEVTQCDRSGGIRDAGGFLGGPGAPDLRNLQVHFCLIDEGDLLLAVSDGVHDNLDPEVLHVPPIQAGIRDFVNWGDVEPVLKNVAKAQYKETQLRQIIAKIQDISPQSVSTAVMQFVFDSTADHRNAYESGSQLQLNWASTTEEDRARISATIAETLRSPVGKFDHVTCLCVQATRSNVAFPQSG